MSVLTRRAASYDVRFFWLSRARSLPMVSAGRCCGCLASPTREAVYAQGCLAALAVAVLSLAGDAHGCATRVNLDAVAGRWRRDCCASGVSAATANVGTGGAAVALCAAAALSGLVAVGATLLSVRRRVAGRRQQRCS